MSLNLDDPRLTAYAVGELDGPEHEADRDLIEQLLAESAEAREIVAQQRATAALLNEALCLQESPGLDDVRRAAIFAEESQLSSSPMRIHLGDAPKRTDVYHVITHPVPEPRRYRTNLLAVAAAIAIVALSLALVIRSIFPRGSAGPLASNPTSPGSPQILPRSLPQPDSVDQGQKTDELPTVPDPIVARSARDIADLLPDAADASRPLFGVTSLPVTPKRFPSTRDSSALTGYALSFENPFFEVARNPLSTFSFNVAGISYDSVRRALAQKQLPDQNAVQIEELINAFRYDYAAPTGPDVFAAHVEIAACPWNDQHRLVRVGLKAKEAPGDQPVAKDLSIRLEFNPAQVGSYRLIGYDRRLPQRDMASNRPKHNQVLSGQSVTALYELIPATDTAAVVNRSPAPSAVLKYQKPSQLTPAASSEEILTLKLKYFDPSDLTAPAGKIQEFAIADNGFAGPGSDDFKFAAAVAAFGMILRDSPNKGAASYDVVLLLAQNTKRADPLSERAKFMDLVEQAKRL